MHGERYVDFLPHNQLLRSYLSRLSDPLSPMSNRKGPRRVRAALLIYTYAIEQHKAHIDKLDEADVVLMQMGGWDTNKHDEVVYLAPL